MMHDRRLHDLRQKLPPVRGEYVENASLKKMTWFRTGGEADIVFRPADAEDLSVFLSLTPRDIPVTVLGVGSNMLVRDGGIAGVVIKLGKAFAAIEVNDLTVTAGAGAIDITVAQRAAEQRVAGLEFLRGIPGSIGGAVAMNAGAYGSEVSDCLTSVTLINRSGEILTKSASELDFSYRSSNIGEGDIVISATFEGERGDPKKIVAKMNAINDAREETQPLRQRTGGSTFKNPNRLGLGDKSAWQLIDAAGCRGLRLGGASMSEKHCNFMLNDGSASAQDLEGLGEEVRRRVLDITGVSLEWEIKRVGIAGVIDQSPGDGGEYGK